MTKSSAKKTPTQVDKKDSKPATPKTAEKPKPKTPKTEEKVVPTLVVVPVTIAEPVEPEGKPFDMSRKSGGPNSIGIPKCKKPWKFSSGRSAI